MRLSHRVEQVGGEGSDATLARQMVADEGDLANLRYVLQVVLLSFPHKPKKSSYPVASARRPVLPMTLPPRKERKAALRISFHRSPCVNCSAMVLIRLRKPLTLVSISAICEAFACMLVISTVV